MLMLRVFAALLFVLFSAYYFINFNYILLVTCTIYTIYNIYIYLYAFHLLSNFCRIGIF